MKIPQSESKRAAAGVGLAFFVGCIAFAGTFLIVRHFTATSDVPPILPPAQRKPAAVSMLRFRNADGSAPATRNEKWTLEDCPGQIVVVNYFATWCPPCIQEMPDLMKLSAQYAARGVVFVEVCVNDPTGEQGKSRDEILRTFAENSRLSLPILVPAADSDLWKSPETIPVPQTFLYDKQHRRAQSILGEVDEATLRTSLETLLKE